MSYLQLIKSFPTFLNLSEIEVTEIISSALEKTIPTSTTFISQGENPDYAYLILKGSARAFSMTEEGDEVNLNFLGPGDWVGEMALIDNELRSAYVETLQQSQLLAFPKEQFIKILHQYPSLTISFLTAFSKRIREINQNFESVSSEKLLDRTLHTLNRVAKYFPNRDIALSQEELAEIIGATRARVTEVLNELQKEGKITLSHRHIHLS